MASLGGSLLAGAGAGATVTVLIKAIDEASGVFSKVNKSALAAGAAITGIGIAGAAMLTKTINSASDLNESINAVQVTFGNAADEVLKLGENSATAFGMSKNEFNSSAVMFSNFATTVAGEGGNVADVIQQMTQRTADFASVMNIDLADAQVKIQSGLAGETEALRRYGIDVSAAAVETYAYSSGIANAGEKLTESQKVMARWGLIVQQTDKFAGDFANTSDSLANRQRILKASLEDTKATMGQALLPVAEKLVGVLQKIVTWMSEHPKLLKFAAIIAAVATAFALVVGPLVIIVAILPAFAAGLGIVTGGLFAMAGGLTAVTVAGLPLWAFLLILAAAIAAVIIVGKLLIKHWDDIKEGLGKLWNTFKETLGKIAEIFKTVWTGIKNFFESIWNGIVKFFEGVWEVIKKIAFGIANAFIKMANVVGSVWNSVVTGIERAINVVVKGINALIKLINKIPGVNIGLIRDVSLDKFKIPEIPYLAEGGIVKKPTLAMLGENGPEKVIPLNGKNSGGITINIDKIYASKPQEVADAIYKKLKPMINI